MHGQFGSREGRRPGILGTDVPSRKGLDVRLWITVACSGPVEETAVSVPTGRKYTPIVPHLSVGTSGDTTVLTEVVITP